MTLQWIGIIVCIIHSAIFSGLNLGFFGLSRLKLVVQAETDDNDAARILNLRKDAHLLLSTLLWGNVASNVLLALFAESIFSGLGAFLFSTIGITFFGEIIPQAYLVKNTLKASKLLAPIVRFYQIVFYPIAKPTALLLDQWLGKETISFFQENELEILLKKHEDSASTDIETLEAVGAINFLKIDDIDIKDEGEIIHPESIIQISSDASGKPTFPKYTKSMNDPFLAKVNKSEEKWVILTNESNHPILVLNADQFLRDILYKESPQPLLNYCHEPIVITDSTAPLGEAIVKFTVNPENSEDDVVDNDVILLWSESKRIITGADILGRLLRGVIFHNHTKRPTTTD